MEIPGFSFFLRNSRRFPVFYSRVIQLSGKFPVFPVTRHPVETFDYQSENSEF